MTHYKVRLAGYTILELLIVIVSMTLLFGIGFANFRQYQKRQKLEAVARQVLADLRWTQEQALAGVKPNSTPDNPCETPGSILLNYSFVRSNPSTYHIEATCTAGSYIAKGDVDLQASGIQMSVFLPPTIPPNRLQFLPLGKGVENLNSGYSEMTLTQVASGATRVIRVTTGGEIR